MERRAECQVFVYGPPDETIDSQYGVIRWADYCQREVERLRAVGRRARTYTRAAGEMTVVADAVTPHIANPCWCTCRHRGERTE
jgi:hypothetical protein